VDAHALAYARGADGIALLLFVGAMGKSAQIPCTFAPGRHGRPDACEWLIHAATMVTAGVYMVARMNAVYHSRLRDGRGGVVGAVTAIFGVHSASAERHQEVLAYSTSASLVHVPVLGVGIRAEFPSDDAAFFKLCFPRAGSVIHAMSGEQIYRRWAACGTRFRSPRRRASSQLWRSGNFSVRGFFSKDEILGEHSTLFFFVARRLHHAGMTAFYMFGCSSLILRLLPGRRAR